MHPTASSPIVMLLTAFGAGDRTTSSIHALISIEPQLPERHATDALVA